MPDESKTAAPKHGDIRYDKTGPIKAMAYADGYVMVRRPYCAPWVLSLKDWGKLGGVEAIGRSDAPHAMSYGVLS